MTKPRFQPLKRSIGENPAHLCAPPPLFAALYLPERKSRRTGQILFTYVSLQLFSVMVRRLHYINNAFKDKFPLLFQINFYQNHFFFSGQSMMIQYYHWRSTMKRERFFAQVYFSNETVSQTTVSTGPMKMFRLEHETMNVCQRNVARFGHV